MIYSAADYQFVSGDLDKIKIDGGIMPLRANKRELRGEDIAFLLEAVMERHNALDNGSRKTSFSRRILASQPREVWLEIANRWDDYARYLEVYEQVFDHSPTKEDHDWSIYEKRLSEGDTFFSGDVVKAAPIERLFEDVSKLNRWVTSVTNTTLGTTAQSIIASDPDSYGNAWVPWWKRGGSYIYSYCMESWPPVQGWYDSGGSCRFRTSTNGLTFTNKFAKAATILATFEVRWQDTSTTDRYRWCVIPLIPDHSEESFTISDSLLYAAAVKAYGMCGLSETAYPGRVSFGGDLAWQLIAVRLTGVQAVCELRDRTRW